MKEIFLSYIWENRLLSSGLSTTDGQEIEVMYPGIKNTNAGPDFLNARIRIGDAVWAGNVELHVNASDWYSHRHNTDKGYDNVILHVVYQADKATFTTVGHSIPTVQLKGFFDENLLLRYRSFIDSKTWIACQKSVTRVQRFTWLSWLDRMIVERLEFKVEEVLHVFEQTGNDWEETLYRRMMSNFGFKVNDEPFLRLGRMLPFQLLLRHSNQVFQLEALLFGVAGFLQQPFSDEYPLKLKKEFDFLQKKYELSQMNPEQWRFMRMRPSNFPTIRIAQMAALINKSQRVFSRITEANSIEEIKALFDVYASEYWDNHFQFERYTAGNRKHLGQDAVDLILINTIVQVLFAYGIYHTNETYKDKALMILETLDAENNEIIRKFSALGVNSTHALQSQALLHLRKNYCNPKRCLECRIGQLLIRSETEENV